MMLIREKLPNMIKPQNLREMALMSAAGHEHWTIQINMRPCELLDARQFKVVEVYQTKGRPEERLSRLPEAGDDHVRGHPYIT